jgi:hypothetical protein
MKKITQKMIRRYLYETGTNTVDCTNWTNEDYDSACQKEGRLEVFARSYGTYGCNGLVAMGRKTGTYYVVTKRSSAVFLFSW